MVEKKAKSKAEPLGERQVAATAELTVDWLVYNSVALTAERSAGQWAEGSAEHSNVMMV
jgi:hypothetical protein